MREIKTDYSTTQEADADTYFMCQDEDGVLRCSCGRELIRLDDCTLQCSGGYPTYRLEDGGFFIDKFGNIMLKHEEHEE